jgi:hypothetical protein
MKLFVLLLATVAFQYLGQRPAYAGYWCTCSSLKNPITGGIIEDTFGIEETSFGVFLKRCKPVQNRFETLSAGF